MKANNIQKKITRKFKMAYMISRYEKQYQFGQTKLKYLFIPERDNKKLLIVFSAFPGIDQPAKYNYVSAFKNVKCNKLFILDNFGPTIRGGSYYLGKNRDFFIKNAVEELISMIANVLGILKKDIICCGTSKGGYASLYFGLKNQYGTAIVGAPQTLLGDYLSIDDHLPYLEYIAGGVSNEDKKFLNDILFNIVPSGGTETKVFIHVGTNDHHYIDHVMPFADYLSVKRVPFDLDLQDYRDHNDVGAYYPSYALSVLDHIL